MMSFALHIGSLLESYFQRHHESKRADQSLPLCLPAVVGRVVPAPFLGKIVELALLAWKWLRGHHGMRKEVSLPLASCSIE